MAIAPLSHGACHQNRVVASVELGLRWGGLSTVVMERAVGTAGSGAQPWPLDQAEGRQAAPPGVVPSRGRPSHDQLCPHVPGVAFRSP